MSTVLSVKASLYRDSLNIIRRHQAPSGAYIASPNFPSYAYAWLRDGSFVAHAMDQAGQFDSSAAFYRWAHRTVQQHAWKVDHVAAALRAGKPLADGDFLHTRYTLDGQEVPGDFGWGNFQYDGYGTWLWALNKHVRLSGDAGLLREVAESVALTARYLVAVWKLPAYDCWEENPEHLHPYSLAAAYGGLCAALQLAQAGALGLDTPLLAETAQQIREYVIARGVRQGRVVKSIRPSGLAGEPAADWETGVDASLIALATPYGLFSHSDPLFQATLEEIESDLRRPDGGVYRYTADTYYGGGEWVLLAAWLGWHYAESGQAERAASIVRWVEAQVDADGWLPEQVPDHMLAPSHLPAWQAKWGPAATPLLWSHAMYVILCRSLERARAHA